MAVITISRGTFSGGQSIAECVAKKLGYRSIGGEIFEETARSYGIQNKYLSEAMIGTPRIIEKFHSARKKYLVCLQASLINASRNDDLVYYGNAGHFLLKSIPHAIKVRIIASMEFRIGKLINHENISKVEAAERIKKMDKERAKWTKYLYHANWYDPGLYDIVINLDNVSISGACNMLFKTATMKEYKLTAESQRKMEDLVLSSHLKAIIANTRSIDGGEDVDIEANGGVVIIKGTVASLADADRVRILVRKTPGVKDIISCMKVRLPCISLANVSLC